MGVLIGIRRAFAPREAARPLSEADFLRPYCTFGRRSFSFSKGVGWGKAFGDGGGAGAGGGGAAGFGAGGGFGELKIHISF